jgi:glycosyltransferase involved in cell wall biosynthesis
MNILIYNWRDPKNPKAGGAETVTLEYAKCWVNAGNNVFWFASSFKNAKKRETIEGIEIIRFGNTLTVFLGAVFYYFFSKEHFDLVIDEFHGIPFFTPLFVRGKKIAFIHEVAGEIWKYMYPFPFSLIGRVVESLAFKIYRNVPFITVSLSTANELKKEGIKKIEVLTNGIHLIMLPDTIKKERELTFICVSRLVKMKGIEDVLLAFQAIHNENKQTKLWIVGDGQENYVNRLKHIVQENNLQKSVTFYGEVSEQEKLKLMKQAHLLLHTSIKEGWGLVIIEAASQGTPAVVYNVGGLRDSVKNGKTGIVLKNNTPSEMAIQTLQLLKDFKKYHAFQQACLTYAKSLSWKNTTQKSLKLLNDE